MLSQIIYRERTHVRDGPISGVIACKLSVMSHMIIIITIILPLYLPLSPHHHLHQGFACVFVSGDYWALFKNTQGWTVNPLSVFSQAQEVEEEPRKRSSLYCLSELNWKIAMEEEEEKWIIVVDKELEKLFIYVLNFQRGSYQFNNR